MKNGYSDVDVVFYEGGPERMLPFFSTANRGQRSHAVHRHPRFFGLLMNTFRQYDEAGCALFNIYFLNGVNRSGASRCGRSAPGRPSLSMPRETPPRTRSRSTNTTGST